MEMGAILNQIQDKYNYQHYNPQSWIIDMMEKRLRIGNKLDSSIHLYETDYHLRTLDELLEEKKVVIETASLSSPHFVANISAMEKLSLLYNNITFIVLYVREEHPGELIPHHKNLRQKINFASKLSEVYGLQRMVIVDDLQGSLHNQMGGFPNSSMIVDKKKVVLLRQWNDPAVIQLFLSGLVSPKEKFLNFCFDPEAPSLMTTIKTLVRAGPYSCVDYIQSRPYVWRQKVRSKQDKYDKLPI